MAWPTTPKYGTVCTDGRYVQYVPYLHTYLYLPHIGNVRLRKLVSDLGDSYEKANKSKKSALVESIVQEMKQNDTRFLKMNNKTKLWEEVSYSDAREKVAHVFCNQRRRLK